MPNFMKISQQVQKSKGSHIHAHDKPILFP